MCSYYLHCWTLYDKFHRLVTMRQCEAVHYTPTKTTQTVTKERKAEARCGGILPNRTRCLRWGSPDCWWGGEPKFKKHSEKYTHNSAFLPKVTDMPIIGHINKLMWQSSNPEFPKHHHSTNTLLGNQIMQTLNPKNCIFISDMCNNNLFSSRRNLKISEYEDDKKSEQHRLLCSNTAGFGVSLMLWRNISPPSSGSSKMSDSLQTHGVKTQTTAPFHTHHCVNLRKTRIFSARLYFSLYQFIPIQWNLYLSFPDNSFSQIRHSISMVPERILFQLWLPHLLFSRIHCFVFRPPTKTMNRGFTVVTFTRQADMVATY
jgi:hypothetical protein